MPAKQPSAGLDLIGAPVVGFGRVGSRVSSLRDPADGAAAVRAGPPPLLSRRPAVPEAPVDSAGVRGASSGLKGASYQHRAEWCQPPAQS